MADTKLSALTELDATPAVDDELYIRDVSEAAATESKRITTANLLAANTPTKQFFVPITHSTGSIIAYGKFPVALLNASGEDAYIAFGVPHDFSSITNSEVICIGAATSATAGIDVASYYAADGEAYNTHSESDTASTYSITTDQIDSLDISGILSSLAAGDYVGIEVTYGDTAIYVLGVRFRYA